MSMVDVVIPVYNTPLPALEQAIRSVMAQTLTRWRAVVIDDGSRPEVSSAVAALVRRIDDRRISLIRVENCGVAAARNHGIRISRSPFVALLDSDDIWKPRKLEMQVAAMDALPDVAVAHTAYANFFDEDPRRLIPVRPADERLNTFSPEEACVAMLRRNFVGVSTAMLRRSACEESGYFDTSFRTLEDKELWVRLLLRERRFLHLPEVLMHYRLHVGNISKSTDAMLRGRLALIAKVDELARGAPAWFGRVWPPLRREMRRNAHVEAAESLLDSGEYVRAFAGCGPWRSGIGRRTVRVMYRSVLALAGGHR